MNYLEGNTKKWIESGITKVSDIMDSSGKYFLTKNKLENNFNTNIDALDFLKMKSSVSEYLKDCRFVSPTVAYSMTNIPKICLLEPSKLKNCHVNSMFSRIIKADKAGQVD